MLALLYLGVKKIHLGPTLPAFLSPNVAKFMKEIRVEDAVGQILCHDVTQIIRGVTKGARFRKGHVITAEDIPELLKLGKENIFVWENDASKIHENDAAEILREICQGENLSAGEVREGKIELAAACDGVFSVDADRLNEINAVEEICIATLANKIAVRTGKTVAGMRVIPLVIDREKMARVREIAGGTALMKVAPYRNFRVGLVVTGSEIFHGRIEDTFTAVIESKLKTFGLEIEWRRVSDDSKEMTREKICELLELGAEIVTYGVPVLPGAMFMLAYKGEIPILGLPGCVMYCSKTIFDLALPRILTGERLTRRDFTILGVGGLL